VSVAIVTGAGGLVGSEAAAFLVAQGFDVVGIDNDMRAYFFGAGASTAWRVAELEAHHRRFRPAAIDIRDADALGRLFADLGQDIALVIHAAAQPSHDWAAREPLTDFGVNAVGTLNLLEATRRRAPAATFIFMSTNKVYGDAPNELPLMEQATRWEPVTDHPTAPRGINETMRIDRTTHSLFGTSKAAADLLVQEYGRYFGMNTACFRGGCLTGGAHSGTELHGFLAYLMQCTVTGRPYTVFGHKGKQVRDNLHVRDLVAALWAFAQRPAPAQVYNIGGSRFANVSVLEAIEACERISGNRLDWSYSETARTGDHIWWISDISRFQRDYPGFRLTMDIDATLQEIHGTGRKRWLAA